MFLKVKEIFIIFLLVKVRSLATVDNWDVFLKITIPRWYPNCHSKTGKIHLLLIRPLPRIQNFQKPFKTSAMEKSCLKKPNATNKVLIDFIYLLQRHKNWRLNKGAIDEAMKLFPFISTHIEFIWRQARPEAVDLSVRVEFTTKKKGN